LYKNLNGSGTKAIITPPASGSGGVWVRLYSTHFLNGELADNQVTSWLNNTNCELLFVDDPDAHSPFQLGFVSTYNYGAKGDWAYQYANDKLSGIRIYCP